LDYWGPTVGIVVGSIFGCLLLTVGVYCYFFRDVTFFCGGAIKDDDDDLGDGDAFAGV
jgi:hypothetical protein